MAQRVPLATGATAFRGIFVCAIASGVGGVLVGYIVRTKHGIDQSTQLVMGFFGLVAFVYALVATFGAVSARASDIELTETGFAIVGGPWSALAWAWSTIDPQKVLLSEHALRVDGQTIAEPYDKHENEALYSVARAMIVASSPKVEVPPAPATLEIVRCAACRAPIVPLDAPSVLCRHCGASVHLSPALRARITAARELDGEATRIRRLAERLSHHAPAARANALLLSGGALFVLSVGAATFGLQIGWPSLLLAAVAASLPMLVFARLDIADRTGAVLLASGSAARAPVQSGEPYTCRMCGGPLPDAEEGAIVVRCAYCEANNVLGVDLRLDEGAARWQEGSFAIAAARRRRGEIWRYVSVLVFVALLFGAWKLRAYHRVEAPDPYACIHGNEAACVDFCDKAPLRCGSAISGLLSQGSYEHVLHLWTTQCTAEQDTLACGNARDALLASGHIQRNVDEAVRIVTVACRADATDECCEAALAKQDGVGGAADADDAAAMMKLGCDGHDARACSWMKNHEDLSCNVWSFAPPDPF